MKKRKIKLNKGEAIEMQELDLYLDNDYDLYQVKTALARNYKKKYNKSGFNFEKAEIGVKNLLVDKGARKYAKEFGGNSAVIFPKKVREATAKAQIRKIMQGIREGEFS